MKKVFISELKLLYPFKKAVVLIGECSFVVIAFGAILIIVKRDFSFHGVGGRIFEYIIDIGMIIAPIACFKPTIRYLKPFYRCFRGFPQRVRKELVQSIEEEEFTQLEDLKMNKILYEKVWLSKNWFRINNHYIPRNGVVAMYLEVRHPGNHHYNHDFYLWVVLLNGEYFRTGVIFRLVSEMDREELEGSYLTKHFFAQALQENTSGLVICDQRLNKKEPASVYSSFIKESFKYDLEHLAEIITRENELQKTIVQELLSRWRTDSSRKEGFMLYSDFWKKDEWIRRNI